MIFKRTLLLLRSVQINNKKTAFQKLVQLNPGSKGNSPFGLIFIYFFIEVLFRDFCPIFLVFGCFWF